MGTPAHPYPTRTVVAVGLALAIGFAALSFGFLVLQARNHSDHVAGQVIAVSVETVTIRNARGKETVLTFGPEAKLKGAERAEDLQVGQHVMSRGEFEADGRFEVERLRVLKGGTQK